MRYQIYEAKSVKYDAQQRLSGNRPTFMCLYGMELFTEGAFTACPAGLVTACFPRTGLRQPEGLLLLLAEGLVKV